MSEQEDKFCSDCIHSSKDENGNTTLGSICMNPKSKRDEVSLITGKITSYGYTFYELQRDSTVLHVRKPEYCGKEGRFWEKIP